MVRELFDKLATLAKLCKIEQSLDNMHQNAIALEQEKKQEYQARYDKDMQKIRGIRKWALPLAFYSAVFSIVWVVLAIIGNPQINIFRLVFAALRNPFTLVALIGMVFLCSIKSRKQKHEEKYKQIWNDEYQSQVEDLHAIMERTKSRICELREQNEGVFAFLPGKYRNLQAVSFMLIAVRDGRAETLKEAINLYEEQLHRWKLEDAAYRTAEMQRYTAMAAEELSVQLAEANVYLSSIENMERIKFSRINT